MVNEYDARQMDKWAMRQVLDKMVDEDILEKEWERITNANDGEVPSRITDNMVQTAVESLDTDIQQLSQRQQEALSERVRQSLEDRM